MDTDQKQTEVFPSIYLTYSNYRQELIRFWRSFGMPRDLIDCLIELVSSHIHSLTPPEATPQLIELAKRFLRNGIVLADSYSKTTYDVMVFVPNPGEEKGTRSFFRLIRKWPGGELKYPWQM